MLSTFSLSEDALSPNGPAAPAGLSPLGIPSAEAFGSTSLGPTLFLRRLRRRRLAPNPLTLPGADKLQAWFQSTARARVVTLPSTGGSSPPVLTVSSVRTDLFDLRIECRSSTDFRWSIDGGAHWSVDLPIATSVDLGNGIVVGFPAGVYVNGQSWRGGLDNAGRLGAGWVTQHTVNFGSSKEPFGALNVLGRHGYSFDGVNQSISRAIPTSLIGDDVPFTGICVAQVTGAVSGRHPIWSFCGGSTASGYFELYCESSVWKCGKRGDAGGSVSQPGGTADNLTHLFEVVYDGSNVLLDIDEANVIPSSLLDTSTMTTPTLITIAQNSRTGAVGLTDNWGAINFGEGMWFAGVLSADERRHQRRYLKRRHGL